MSKIDIAGRATVTILSNLERFLNRPAYFADYTVSTNQLLAMVRKNDGDRQWNVVNVPLAAFFADAEEAYIRDTHAGVKDRLKIVAYQMLGTYGVFEEEDRHGTDVIQRKSARRSYYWLQTRPLTATGQVSKLACFRHFNMTHNHIRTGS